MSPKTPIAALALLAFAGSALQMELSLGQVVQRTVEVMQSIAGELNRAADGISAVMPSAAVTTSEIAHSDEPWAIATTGWRTSAW